MNFTRPVTARQFPELLARGETVSIELNDSDAFTHVNLESAILHSHSRVEVRWSDGKTGTYHPNERYQIIDWPAVWAEQEADAQAEYEAERAVERFYEEGTPEQYRWEVEQDERNAAFWGGRF